MIMTLYTVVNCSVSMEGLQKCLTVHKEYCILNMNGDIRNEYMDNCKVVFNGCIEFMFKENSELLNIYVSNYQSLTVHNPTITDKVTEWWNKKE